MAREPIPTWFFALAVVRLGQRFLLVHEAEHGRGWWLPGGRVEPGEDLAAAARRETLEEAGVRIAVEGVLRVEHTPLDHAARVRVVFVARPLDDTPPKRERDEHSLGAAWKTLEEVERLPLRGNEVLGLLRHVAAGALVCPLAVLAREEAPYA